MFFVVLIICGFIAIYETYTGAFRIARIERTARLLESLAALEVNPSIKADEILLATQEDLKAQLAKLSSSQSTGSHPIWRKLFMAALPWCLLSLGFFVGWRRGDASSKSAFFGSIVIGIPFIVGGACIPMFERTWINYGIYPWGSFIGFLLLLVIFSKISKK